MDDVLTQWRAPGERVDADRQIEAAAAPARDDAEVEVSLARAAVEQGNWLEALRRWQIVSSKFKALPEGFCGAAQALMELGRFEEAKGALAPALRMLPDDLQVALTRGWIATRGRAISDAEIAWRHMRRLFPDHPDGYIGWATALRDEGRLDEARQTLLDAAERFPDIPNIAMDLAQIFGDKRDWPASIAQWQSVLRRFPDEPRGYMGLGEAFLASGDDDAARIIFSTGVQLCPDDFYLAAADAGAAVALHGVPEAIARWSALIRRHPGNPQAYIGCGRALRDGGELDLSLQYLHVGLSRFPENFEIELQIALTLSAKRDWPKAMDLWESLKRRFPANGAVRSCITSMLWQARQDQMALQAADGAVPFDIPRIVLENRAGDADGADELKALFARFESIGDSCEFGLVQRRFGAEPLSLLRWASTPPDQLIAGLQTDFAGVGEPAYTTVEIAHGEFTTRDKRYYMFSHTFIPAKTETLESFAARHLPRMQYLRRKFIEDLKAAKRLLVYKSREGVTEAQADLIYNELRRFNPANMLLCVRLQTPECPSGTVRRIGQGLFEGYIDRFSTVDISFDVWVSLCRKVVEWLAAEPGIRAAE